MPVKITIGEELLYPLTSRPEKPKPAPAEELIAKIVPYGDREIVVTIPFPDTIELVAEITNDDLVTPDTSKKSVKQKALELDQGIQGMLAEVALGVPSDLMSGSYNQAKTKAEFKINYDPIQPLNRAHLVLWREQTQDFGVWKVRFEFSAAKAGPAGILKLIAGLSEALAFVNIGKLIAKFRVSRVDAAIDCIGAYPLDLIAHISKPGKRSVYVGDHGRPESVYFYEKKKPPLVQPKAWSYRTLGPHRLTLYERRDYHRQLMIEPPYGDCPVTRAEVPIRWKKTRPLLTDLAGITNLFAGRRVAYAANVGPSDKGRWRQFCVEAFGAGTEKSLMGWVPGPGGKYAKLYRDCVGDLIDPTCWANWQAGIAATGLVKLIAVGNSPNPAGSPVG